MLDADKNQFAKIVRTTMLVCGGEAPEADVLRVWWAALADHSIEDVSAAFSQYAIRGKFAPKPADILEILDRIKPDGRPGADEAWAMIPKDEDGSVVWSDEMAQAYGIAIPLLEDGDKVAARMAFKDAYQRIVEQNKLNNIPPSWSPSLGRDPHGRTQAVEQAMRLGRIEAHQAAILLPAESSLRESKEIMQLECKSQEISKEQRAENIARLKAMLGKSSIATA